MTPEYRKRLLNVARALRESPNPGEFTMCSYGWACGTPACALGHYAARRDLQRSFRLVPDCVGRVRLYARGRELDYWDDVVCKHFGIGFGEALDLFSSSGCNDAATAVAAAEYIEDFVARKWGSS